MLVDEEHIMFEAGVEMWFKPKLHNHRIVVAVYVSIHPVQTLEELLYEGWKGFREWHTDSAWKHLFVVYVTLCPAHEMLDILRSRHFRWPLEVFGILPQVFEFVCSLHLWTRLWGAKLCDGPIKEIDLIVEVDDIDS